MRHPAFVHLLEALALATGHAKNLERLERESRAASLARGSLPPGSSRARVTTANAKWVRKTEARERAAADLMNELMRVRTLAERLP